jgi:peptidoglycan hydrolase-like amidase
LPHQPPFAIIFHILYSRGDFEVVYKFDIESLLTYYQGIFSNSALEKLTGINQKQLWAYAHVKSKPRPAQVKATRGQVLMYENEICDARFSKCCGGISEDFKNVW